VDQRAVIEVVTPAVHWNEGGGSRPLAPVRWADKRGRAYHNGIASRLGMALGLHSITLGLLAALVLQVLLNLRAIPRLSRMGRGTRRAAVLIPARNEAEVIAAAIEAWAHQDHPDYEVIVLDDDSTDGTVEVARAAAARFPRVRVVRGTGLMQGWRGKPWACHRLRAGADGDVLVFADADVHPGCHVLSHLVGALDGLPASLVSVLPSHAHPNWLVWAVLGLQNWAAMTLAPMWLRALRRRPLLTATNGQLLAIDAAAYDGSGGFASVRGTLAEDAALGRRVARLGHEVRLVDGGSLVVCQAYPDLPALWRANVRNLHAVLFGSATLGVAGAAGLAVLFVGPALLVARGLISGRATTSTWLAAGELALGYVGRMITDRRVGYPRRLSVLHPLAVALLAGMLLESTARAVLRSPVEWRGRRYRVRDEST
jgi:cellulose synthase/poly-beta-1,6-N-acetylglucosamine synthase-like glycosyltransferase